MNSERPPPSSLGRRLLAAARGDTSWIVRVGDDRERTLTTREIVDAYNERLIDPDTYVWTDGMRTWQKLQAVDAIVEALHACAAEEEASHGPRRHEDSAIFSLATLVGERRCGEPSAAASEDSGLIDLAALTDPSRRADPASAPAPAAGLMAGGLFPEAAAAVQAAAPSPPTRAPRNDRRLVIGLGITATVLLCALVFQIARMQGEAPLAGPASPPPATVAADSAPSATPPAAAEPSSAAATEPGAPQDDEADPAATTSPIARSSPAATPRPIGAERRPQPSGQPPVPPAPARSAKATSRSCPCPVDDLMCQMRCATGR